MNRSTRARDLLLANMGRVVTLREMAQAGVCEFYTVRNAVAEAKDLLGKGYKVTHVYSKDGIVSNNGYKCEFTGAEAQGAPDVAPATMSAHAPQAGTFASANGPKPCHSAPVSFDKKQACWDDMVRVS